MCSVVPGPAAAIETVGLRQYDGRGFAGLGEPVSHSDSALRDTPSLYGVTRSTSVSTIWRFKSSEMGLSNLLHRVASNASADFNWLA